MPVVLRQLSLNEVESILGHGPNFAWHGPVHCGALPPDFVLQRALARVDAGEPTSWWLPFLIVEPADQAVAGGCAFKGLPRNGRVEVLYGVAKSRRGHGIASAALTKLVAIAFSNGATEVLAEIEPRNAASIAAARKCGFAWAGERAAEDGALVEQWVLVREPDA